MAETRIRLVSGSATIGETLPAPIIAGVLDANQVPLVGERVIFRVIENNG